MDSIAKFSFCTHLTFDLILRLRRISRLGIHPYGCWHTSRNTISTDATFYSILPSEEFFHGMDCQLLHSAKVLIGHLEHSKFCLKFENFRSKTCFSLWQDMLENICQNIYLINVLTEFQSPPKQRYPHSVKSQLNASVSKRLLQ